MLVNLFLANIGSVWVYYEIAPKHFYRYVDDIFTVFDSNHDTPIQLLEYLNNQHKNSRFTTEIGATALPFLAVFVDVRGTPLKH